MAVDAGGLATLLLACPYVRGLHTGPHGAIVTDSPSGRVAGVLVAPEMIVLGLVVSPRVDQEQLAAQIRARLARYAPGVPVSLALTAPQR